MRYTIYRGLVRGDLSNHFYKLLFNRGYVKLLFIMFIIFLMLTSNLTLSIKIKQINNTNPVKDPSGWTPIDVSEYTVDVVGEKTGSAEGQPFKGWYTDTVVVDKDSGTIIVAWARWNADIYDNDYIFLSFFIPIDADGDGSPEAYQKIIKLVDETQSLESLDSLTIGSINGKKYVLVTWTYYDSTYKNNVAGALYNMSGDFIWKGNIRSTTSYEEYSRSCYVPDYNSNSGGFLIIWYTGYDDSIDGKWLYYDSTNGWTLTTNFDIDDTNNLYYTKADQMLCIGGQSKALVVFRKYDSTEGYPDLYAALVDTSNNVQEVKLYDYDGDEETVGVRGAYTGGYFIVPLLSGTYVRYDIVRESDGYVWHRDYVTSNGEHPYAIALSDRFVLAWIDHYNDDDGEPKVANIDLTDFYIHPQYGVSVTGGDSNIDKHPLVASPSSGNLLYIWTSSSDGTTYDIKIVKISLGNPTDSPSVGSVQTLVSGPGSQIAHGFGVAGDDEYLVAYTDTSDKEEDLLGYVSLPDSDSISTITLYELPRDADNYKQEILDLINNAQSKVYVAVAFFQEDNPGSPGTISKALVDAHNRGVDVKVIIDNSSKNKEVYDYLKSNGVPIINDSTVNDATHIMHDKFMIVDDNKILVSTVNFIPDDFTKNNNTAIYIESKTVAYFYEQEFLHMWNNGDGRFGIQKTDDHSFIAFTTYSGRTIIFEGYFTPQSYGVKGRVPEVVAGYVNRTSSCIYFASYIFTTSYYVTPIYDGIVKANARGITVRGVFDEGLNVDVPGRRLYWFIDNNVPVAIDNHPYKMHAKLFAIDNGTAIIGSWNPTKTASINHDENILVIRDPDTNNGFAEQIAEYILEMYNSDLFVKSPYQYNPKHPVITKVMFKPDDTNNPDYEWVEIYNPTGSDIDLSNYVIGDSENLINGDDEGMYKFPSGATLPAHGYITIAYKATLFREKYGFNPTYEIVDTDPTVPDLTPYDTSKFTGSWNLSDAGDEVILAEDTNGFLLVRDAVWYGDSQYMTTSIGQPNSGEPLDTSSASPGDGIVDKAVAGLSTYYDAIRMSDKYTIQSNPQPIPELWLLIAAGIIITITVYTIKHTR